MPEQKEYVISLREASFKHGKKRASHAVRILRKFLKRRLKEDELIIDPELNHFIWSRGIRHPPAKIAVVLEREKSTEPWVARLKQEEAQEGVQKAVQQEASAPEGKEQPPAQPSSQQGEKVEQNS